MECSLVFLADANEGCRDLRSKEDNDGEDARELEMESFVSLGIFGKLNEERRDLRLKGENDRRW